MQVFNTGDAKNNWDKIAKSALKNPVTVKNEEEGNLIVMPEALGRLVLKQEYEKLKADIQKGIRQLDSGKSIDGPSVHEEIRKMSEEQRKAAS